MFVVLGRENNKISILDTEDEAVEIFSTSDVKHFVVDLDIKTNYT